MKSRTDFMDGLAVLVVEDEALVAMNLESILEDFGCSIVGPAMRLGRALMLIRDGAAPDAAILDVNLAGEKVFPLAEELASRGIPFIFATGYGIAGIPERFHDRPILQKPYSADGVVHGLREALKLEAREGMPRG